MFFTTSVVISLYEEDENNKEKKAFNEKALKYSAEQTEGIQKEEIEALLNDENEEKIGSENEGKENFLQKPPFEQTAIFSKYFLPFVFIRFLITWFFNKNMIFKLSGAQEIKRKDNKKLYNIVENLCISRGLTTPRIGIIEDQGMNAFAVGWKPQKSRIVFSRGLIKNLNKKEIRAVAAHELTHIINKDTLLMTLIIIYIGIFSTIGEILLNLHKDRTLTTTLSSIKVSANQNKPIGGNILSFLFIFGLFFALMGFIIFPFIKLAISRKREFLADAGALKLTKNKRAVISALFKIYRNPTIKSLKEGSIANICIEDPIDNGGIMQSWLNSHPTIRERIRTLKNY